MNKKLLMIVGVVVLLLLGGWYFMSRKSSPAGTSNAPAASASSLKDLISKGLAQSCTYSADGNSGTVYVSGGKVRTDFDTTIDGKVTKSHMIVDGNTSYLWMDGQPTGYKMTFDTSATPSAESPGAPAGSFDANANMNYNCKTWVADTSMFALPKGVQFMSFGAGTTGSPATGGNSSQCSYCNTLTGDSKTQCLAALKCQ